MTGPGFPHPHGTPWILVRGLFVLAVGACASASVWADHPTPDLAVGQALYVQHCARCHGDQGRGDGVDAKRFYPRPRDFSVGVYKFRSTASGTPPTDEDLFRTITQGLPGSNMPDWRHLDEASRWQLVSYLKSLSPIFTQRTPEPVTLAPDPGPTRINLAKGKQVYEQLGCAACHGTQGRANGSSAAGLVDDWGMKVRPANLTKGWNYRGGSDARSVMLRLLAGIDGAGMPSYAGAVSPDDAWQVAYYVTSLQESPHWNLIARATYVAGALPATINDPRWDLAERTDVRVRNVVSATGEWLDPPTVNSVAFQALYNDDAIAFRVSWDDPTHDVQATLDRLAILLRPPSIQGDVVTLQAWPYQGAPRLDFCYWSADAAQAVETLAADYESVVERRGPQTSLRSVAGYEDGRWRVVVQRARQPANPGGAALMSVDAFHPIAFVVWDGGTPNARAVSSWVEVVLRKVGAPISAKTLR